MSGLPRDYDEWRTRNAEDEEDIQTRKRQRELDRAERADYERDRKKDEVTVRDELFRTDCDA